jgi:hypothetical protein
MRSARFGLLFSFLLFSIPLWAQQSQSIPARVPEPAPLGPILGPPDLLTAPVRDAQALDVVQRALTAMGGPAIAAIQDTTIQAQSDASAEPQSISGMMTWKMAGAEFRIDGPGPNGTASVLTGHGKPTATNGTTKALPTYVTQALFVPVAIASVLAQELANPMMSLRFKDNETLGTESVTVVTTALEMDYPGNVVTPQTWYFDASTGLPVRVEFRSPDIRQAVNFIPSAVDLSNYKTVSGVAYPFTVVSSVDGKTQVVFTVQSVVVNSGIGSSEFDNPGGAL